ncbi:hypothetical protein Peur_052840 [Populus x canadensis]
MGSIDDFSRNSFPDDFVFGTSSSAYQYEGATNKHGRGPANWDTFTVEHTERINDHSNGNVAVDFYHRYKEDVQRMKEMGMDAFRFSISWSRVLPHGRLSAGVNEEGIKFYNDLIDDLLKNGLQPYVTLFHWDTPQALEDKYGGFLSPNIVNDFRDFVDLCFQNFGDRVKKWITLNEPWMFSVQGYDMGTMAPGRISVVVNDPHRSLNTGATEVYTVSHHLLLAHAAAVKLYKEKYQSCQGGQIGITLVSYWFEPYSNSEADQNATKRSLDFMLGWFMDPLTNGDYPRNMHDFVGGRLPEFTAEESKMLKGSYDFIGINYYTTYYAQNIDANYQSVGFMSDARANWTGERNGIPIGPQAGVKWLYIYPEGISRLLNYTKDLYGSPTIYITENERIKDHSNGNVAVDFYHRYKEDVQRMKEMGMDAFRFSISWSRVLPHGRLSAGVNEEGIKFYNDLIDDLLKNGLQPYVTLFHWDTPQALEDKYGGFLSPNIVNDFRDFVDLCFQNFGDRVKKWITLNEPWMFSVQGYDMGTMAPGRISVVVNDPHRSLNTGATEVYTVSHHLLLAHAAAVKLYKEKYQSCQGGQIGITLVSYWFEPYSNSEADQNATKRSLDFMLGWFMDPLTNGDYPRNMHDFVGGRLPEFTAEESKMLKGSYDFIGINYYTTYYAQNIDANYQSVGFMSDARVNWTGERNGIPIGPQAGVKWLYIYPEGISRLLNYTKDLYGSPTIYITENGVDDVNNNASSLKEALNDPIREKSYKDHLKNVLRSINEHGVDVKGFFAWSLMDNFEWGSGYAVRFGLYYVDYKNDLKRYPKQSVKWFKQFLRRDSHSPIPHTYPLITSNETSKVEDGLVRDAKRPRNA